MNFDQRPVKPWETSIFNDMYIAQNLAPFFSGRQYVLMALYVLFIDFMKMKRFNFCHVIFFTLLNLLLLLKLREVDIDFISIPVLSVMSDQRKYFRCYNKPLLTR